MAHDAKKSRPAFSILGSRPGKFTNVWAENLSHMLATDYIAIYPWQRSAALTFQVVVRITQFEGAMGEQGMVTARWQILDAQEQQELMRKTSRFTLPVGTEDYRAMAAALSRALGDLSQDITVALQVLAQNASTR